jgi:hypothetical protein
MTVAIVPTPGLQQSLVRVSCGDIRDLPLASIRAAVCSFKQLVTERLLLVLRKA